MSILQHLYNVITQFGFAVLFIILNCTRESTYVQTTKIIKSLGSQFKPCSFLGVTCINDKMCGKLWGKISHYDMFAVVFDIILYSI